MAISPTAEGFRAAFRVPSLTLGEVAWRWVIGATATALFCFGLFEYLSTLPVTTGDLLFLRSRQPYLVGRAIAHILRGSLGRAVMAGMVAALLLAFLWTIVASLGRIATVRALLDYFRKEFAMKSSIAGYAESEAGTHPMRTLVRLSFLRITVALAAIFGLVGSAIVAGFVSTDANPRPGLAFFLFLPLAVLTGLTWWTLNWLLSLAGVFAVRNDDDVRGAVFRAVSFCREQAGPVSAVSTWTGLAHLVAFVGATTAASFPLAFAAIVPWRLMLLGMILVTLAYFALADWLYTVRLAGYVCIAELPEALLTSVPPTPRPILPTHGLPVAPMEPIQATVDRDEVILSDRPHLPTDT
jgi:hypothetical protein